MTTTQRGHIYLDDEHGEINIPVHRIAVYNDRIKIFKSAMLLAFITVLVIVGFFIDRNLHLSGTSAFLISIVGLAAMYFGIHLILDVIPSKLKQHMIKTDLDSYRKMGQWPDP